MGGECGAEAGRARELVLADALEEPRRELGVVRVVAAVALVPSELARHDVVRLYPAVGRHQLEGALLKGADRVGGLWRLRAQQVGDARRERRAEEREELWLARAVERGAERLVVDEGVLEAAAQRGGRRERRGVAGQREQRQSSSSGSTGWMAADSPALRRPLSTCSATGCSHVPIRAE